jgi:hypothetical protein
MQRNDIAVRSAEEDRDRQRHWLREMHGRGQTVGLAQIVDVSDTADALFEDPTEALCAVIGFERAEAAETTTKIRIASAALIATLAASFISFILSSSETLLCRRLTHL